MTVTTGLPSANSQGTPTLTTEPIDWLKVWADADKLTGLANWVIDEYRKCKSARASIERQWYLNMSFYYGKQYVAPVGNTGALTQTKPSVPWRPRMTVNRIRPIVRMELSKATSQKPNAYVVPASSDDADLFAAQAAEQIWESAYTEKKVKAVLRRAMWWTFITGNGYIKDWWDKDKLAKDGSIGDVCMGQVTPFHVFVPDLREEELENQPYVIHAYTRPAEQVKREYADILGDIDIKGSVVSADEIINNAYLNLNTTNKPEDVLCYEMWLKPGAHPDFPFGGLIQVVDKYVVEIKAEGLPYKHGEYPFTKFSHIPSGKFYATSVIEDVISLQREYNRTRSQIIEAKNRTAKPQLTAPLGSVDPSKITSAPGQVILYKPGFERPAPLPLQALPGYVLEELDRILADIEDITSQHQVSKGSVPPGVTAATAISYLQERDDNVMSPTFDSVEEGMEKLAKHYISHVVQFWDEARTIKVSGDDNAFDTLVLRGADVATGTDIRMEGGSSLPQSKAARQAFLLDLMDRGFIPPEQGLRILEIGGVQKLYDQLQVDERQAQRENLKMKLMDVSLIQQWEQQAQGAAQFAQQMQQLQDQQIGTPDPNSLPVGEMPPELANMLPPEALGQGGAPTTPTDPSQPPAPGSVEPSAAPVGAGTSLSTGPEANDQGHFRSTDSIDPSTGLPLDFPLLVPVNTWDNHAIHIEVHNRFRKGQAFERLPDETKRLFEAHVKQHSDALNNAALSNQALMGAAPDPNAPAQPPSGSNQFTPQPGA